MYKVYYEKQYETSYSISIYIPFLFRYFSYIERARFGRTWKSDSRSRCHFHLNSGDSAFIQATITDSLGRYDLVLKNNCGGILKVTHFAYEDCLLQFTQSASEIQDIILKEKSFLLDEVVIKANPPGLKRKADHFSFEVANTDLVKGNNTWNVLKFTPFLKVDDMTGIEMIGKGKITVYINGRKSHFTGNALKSYLESLPAEEIMNIEITTMANSTFRAQDSGGSINIILKKK